jgi:hypothetical protein
LKNLQLLLIAAIIFGILGVSLVYYEESTGFSNLLIIQPILSAVSAIFLIYALARVRKKGTTRENDQTESSISPPSSDTNSSEENEKPSPEIRTLQRGILIVGMIVELLFGAWIFLITEGQSDNWIYPMIFVAGVPLILWAGRYGRIW